MLSTSLSQMLAKSLYPIMIRRFASASSSPVKPTQKVGKVGRIGELKKEEEDGPSSGQLFIHAGLPMVCLSLLAVWVLKNSIEGKTKEYETSVGQVSKSERQARMEKEHDDMLQKLNKIRDTDFDNTKRIERPDEILERRRHERKSRNVWYRRLGRWIRGQS
mmetsp:Transcript_9594/g.14801  ORF Transcript_9594/g.14801 Transcript_9594/m.14801 type:complete len:162 (+) Transcript_9594:105-590(+)